MNTAFVFFSFAVFGIAVSPSEGKSKRQIWPAPGPDFFTDFRYQQNIPKRLNDFDNADSFWVGPPRFDRRPEKGNGFVRDDFFNDFIPNGGSNNVGDSGNGSGGGGGGGGNRRTTTENTGPITSTPRTIHTAPQNCNCPMTQQFNPVCGTDGNTYRNKGLLNCYQRCGRNVSQKRLGTC